MTETGTHFRTYPLKVNDFFTSDLRNRTEIPGMTKPKSGFKVPVEDGRGNVCPQGMSGQEGHNYTSRKGVGTVMTDLKMSNLKMRKNRDWFTLNRKVWLEGKE